MMPKFRGEANVTNKLTPEHQQRRAIIYVRQSTFIQVAQNRESQLQEDSLPIERTTDSESLRISKYRHYVTGPGGLRET